MTNNEKEKTLNLEVGQAMFQKFKTDYVDPKADKATTVNGHALGSNVTVTKSDVGLGSVVNTGDSATPVSGGTTKFTTGGAYTELAKKVDKVSGKGLSTNDYTTDEKNKLAGIATGAEVNVNADWNATSGDAQILNKPTIPAAVAVKGNAESSYRTGNVNITPANIGLGNVGNFKAVSTVASQGLSDTEKSNARSNIGAGTSSFSGSYNDLSNKPTIPAAAANGTYTIKTLVGSTTTNVSDFTANQSSADDLTIVQGTNVTITPDATNRKITIAATDTNTWRPVSDSVSSTSSSDAASSKAVKTAYDLAASKTDNVGTITGITMNGASKGTSGVVDLGTVLTAHQDISGKADKLPMTGAGAATENNLMAIDANGNIKDSGKKLSDLRPTYAQVTGKSYYSMTI